MHSEPINRIEIARFQLESMSQLVERSLKLALLSFNNCDYFLAQQVITDDKAINSFEIDIDNSTFNILATDIHTLPRILLRQILAIQKLNPILERIGDHAVNIAEATLTLFELKFHESYEGLSLMGEICSTMIQDSLKGFFDSDPDIAASVLARDDIVDDKNIAIINDIKQTILHPESAMPIDRGFELVHICKNLERIADLACNIAEETLYVIDGNSIKHGIGEKVR